MTRTEQTMVQFFEDMGVATRPAKSLADEFDTETDLVDYLTRDETPTDISGVGNASARHIRRWFKTEHPDKEWERKVRSDAYCTEYTTDHGLSEDELDDPDRVHWAWICPKCEHKNVMVGDPNEFQNRPYVCRTCQWVPALDAEAMDDWLEATELLDTTRESQDTSS